MARKLALIIGNSQYDDASLSRLTAPSADVQAFADILRAPDICKFDEVIPLVDEACAVVRKAIARFYDQRKRDDLLLLYFSGHGVKDENGSLYLAVRDTESSLLAGTAIESSFITGRMDRSASKRLVLILDCCHSGAFAAGSKAVQGGSVGTGTAFQGMGRIVLTATDATQYAWEGNRILGDAQTSLFTRFMIEGLKTGAADRDENGVITVDELYEYVYDKVLDATPTQTPGKWAWLKGQIVLVDNAGAKRIARAADHMTAARAAIEHKQFAAALEWLRQAAELDPAAEGLADLNRSATEGLAAAEAAERLRIEIAQKNDEARRQLARQNFSTARVLVEDSLRRDPNHADCKALLEEIRQAERLARAREEEEEDALRRRRRGMRTLRHRLVSGAAATTAAVVLAAGVYKFGARSVSTQPPVAVAPMQQPVNPPAPPVTPPQASAETQQVPPKNADASAPDNRAEQVAAAVKQARQQLARGDRESALKTVGSALALDPNNRPAQMILAELMKDAERRTPKDGDAAARPPHTAGAPADKIPAVQPAAEINRGQADTVTAAPEPKHAVSPPAPAPNAHVSPPAAQPPASAPNAAADSDDVLQVMRQYQAAFNKLDAAAVARIMPSLDAAQLSRNFANLRSYQLDLVNPKASVEGNLAEVSCVRNVVVRPRVGSAQNVSAQTTFRLRRSGASWIIDKVEDR